MVEKITLKLLFHLVANVNMKQAVQTPELGGNKVSPVLQMSMSLVTATE